MVALQIRTDEKPSPYDLDKNGVMVESTSIDLASQVRHLGVTLILYRHLVLNNFNCKFSRLIFLQRNNNELIVKKSQRKYEPFIGF